MRQAAIVLQTRWRGLLARRELKSLREQQREVGFLHVKIQELQTKVTKLEEERDASLRAAPVSEEEPDAKKKRGMDEAEVVRSLSLIQFWEEPYSVPALQR
jgi:myosin heavy subunit